MLTCFRVETQMIILERLLSPNKFFSPFIFSPLIHFVLSFLSYDDTHAPQVSVSRFVIYMQMYALTSLAQFGTSVVIYHSVVILFV